MIDLKILIATPMMPPIPGGPSTHAKKLKVYFGSRAELFNYENYKHYPSGIRHLLMLFTFIFSPTFSFLKYDIIFALDGFTVALPAVLAGIILRKKVILRVGGDFIYENFLYTKETDYESFYNNFKDSKKLFSKSLYIKYLIQKFVTQNAFGIIFNTEWQKDIFLKHYFPSPLERVRVRLFVITNPIEKLENKKTFNNNFNFTSITRDIPYKNLSRVRASVEEARTAKMADFSLELDTKQGTFESCQERIGASRGYICASISDIAPNQVYEALSLGIPVILTKYSGLTKILENTGAVKLIDPFDVEDIKRAILEFCDEAIYRKYKSAAENIFLNFKIEKSWEEMFLEYERIVEKVCNSVHVEKQQR